MDLTRRNSDGRFLVGLDGEVGGLFCELEREGRVIVWLCFAGMGRWKT